MRKVFFQSVNNFDLLKQHVHSAWGATWDVVYFVCLHSYLNIFDSGDERYHEIPAWLLITVNNSTASEVNPYVALLNSVNAWEHN